MEALTETFEEARPLLRKEVLDRDRNRCQGCGKVFPEPDLDIHHVIPPEMGGPNEVANLVSLCSACSVTFKPRIQPSGFKRFLEIFALRLARWDDVQKQLPKGLERLGYVLRLLRQRGLTEGQLDVLLAGLQGESVLFVGPAGATRTISYLVPVLLNPGVATVVASCRMSMGEQMARARKHRVPASYMNGDLAGDEKARRWTQVAKQAFKMVFMAPESYDDRVVGSEEVRRVTSLKPGLMVVDDVQCISLWGTEYHSSYVALTKYRRQLGAPQVLALTTAAGVTAQAEILTSLGLSKVVVAGVERANLAFVRLQTTGERDKLSVITNLLSWPRHGRAIVVVPNKRVAELVESTMNQRGIECPFVDGRNENPKERDTLLGRFWGRAQPPLLQVVCIDCCTVPVDIRDVRLLIHWQPPESAEAYLRSYGHLGLDGRRSVSVVLCEKDPTSDFNLLSSLAAEAKDMGEMHEIQSRVRTERKKLLLEQMYEMSRPKNECFRKKLRKYFRGDKALIKKTFAQRLLERVFSDRGTKVKKGLCCDFCDNIDRGNYLVKLGSLLEQHAKKETSE